MTIQQLQEKAGELSMQITTVRYIKDVAEKNVQLLITARVKEGCTIDGELVARMCDGVLDDLESELSSTRAQLNGLADHFKIG